MQDGSSPISFETLPDIFYHRLDPESFDNISLLKLNNRLATAIGLDLEELQGPFGAVLLSGQATLHGGDAIAMAYSGHQFGHWSGVLGDGRARLVGEQLAEDGRLREIHLKGAGATPYSRGGDGKATLGSAIREYIVSEAVAALGVPTARSLSIVTTGEILQRETPHPGAIVARTALSHIRVGTFQFASAYGDCENVQALADFAIDRLYPEAPSSGPPRYNYFFREVVDRQASLVAKWMLFGFIHGVMNTDNMCVSGETIDYGPCAFMDDFHPGTVFSSIDSHGRYAWNKQPEMAHWNLVKLAETLLPLFGDNDDARSECARDALNTFAMRFEKVFNTGFAVKFGISPMSQGMSTFLPESFRAMTEGHVDFTLFFHVLTRHAAGEPASIVLEQFSESSIGEPWLKNWRKLAGMNIPDGTLAKMRAANPIIIPRNHRVEQAIADANKGDFSTFGSLLAAVTQPYSDKPEFGRFQMPPQPEEVVHKTYCGT